VPVLREEEELLRDAVALEGLDTHDKEEACHDTLRDEVQDDEKWAAHRPEGEEALGQVADALFHDVVGDTDGLALVGLVLVSDLARNAQCRCVEWCLGNKSVGKRDSQKSSDASRQA